MSVINMAKTVKEVYPEAVICYKVGSFCKMFGKDAYVMSYIFGYKLTKDNKENIPSCGFPQRIIPQIIAKLENLKIDYVIISTRNNYEVETEYKNDNLNKYNEIFERARVYIKRKSRIDKIYEELLQIENEKVLKEKIRKIEEILDEE